MSRKLEVSETSRLSVRSAAQILPSKIWAGKSKILAIVQNFQRKFCTRCYRIFFPYIFLEATSKALKEKKDSWSAYFKLFTPLEAQVKPWANSLNKGEAPLQNKVLQRGQAAYRLCPCTFRSLEEASNGVKE